MPIRSRSHELEEESASRLRDLLPPKWVMRPKQPDYGIDFEVELFEPDGRSTGLMSMVQLRATDDASRANTVRLEVDEADYYSQFELPVAVVRYCSVAEIFYWQWASIIEFRTKLESGQVSFTYRFGEGERWTNTTPAEIARTLEVRRALACFPAGAPIPVRLNLERLPVSERYAINRAMDEAIVQSNRTLVRAPAVALLVEVSVTPEPNFLAVRIDSLASATFDLVAADSEDIVTSTLYALVRLLQRKQLARQAEAIARLILFRGKAHYNEDLAISACQALSADLQALVELAIINGFHDQTSVFYGAILLTLSRAAQSLDCRRVAVDAFFAAALTASREEGSQRESAVEYSMGNFYRNQQCLARSFSHYNRARRLRPAYLRAGYFWRELAGVMFLSRRYACAVRAYQTATRTEDDALLSLLLGDALLMAGRVEEALERFDDAVARGDTSVLTDAELKALVCRWLLETGNGTNLPRGVLEADLAMRLEGADSAETLTHIVTHLDGLNPRARFNLGVLRERERNHRNALHNFLLCAFVQPGDDGAWANAAICALALGEAALLTAILSLAIRGAGSDAYDRLRADLLGQDAPLEMIEALDTVVIELLADADRSPDEGFTMRILQGDEYEAMTISGYER